MAADPFVQRETVRWQDLDCQGVLNNAVYLTLFEQARLGYFRSLGCLDRDERFPFLLGETTVRFERPVDRACALDVVTRVVRLGNKSFSMDYEVEHDGVAVARGSATLVWTDRAHQSVRIPDDVRERITAREGIGADDS